ncbi:hypothetical protein [Spongiactinospora sp. TRM90649]|uniref:hypothetical protein n=1 Tax=Spongiactinospora sp. TRM90649 TaxID=3031114 RepID=UPI0023F860FD|nr:hypothetical protein [Spongiactinospora sp. TRM90649]MDF5759350.1 hypothetical protein [Spongiactinospora sp. TRM90649]
MSDGHPTSAHKEAMRLICGHDGLGTDRLAVPPPDTGPSSPNPGYARAITRMAGTPARRLEAQGFSAASGGTWTITATGGALISCQARPG